VACPGADDSPSNEEFMPLAVELRRLAGLTDDVIDEVRGAGPRIKELAPSD